MTIIDRLKTLVEQNPRLWTLAWRILHHPLLLPHDPSYRLVRHLGIQPGELILDIGANSGISALSFMKLCPGVRVVSFEPNPLHELSLARIRAGNPDFSYEIAGLGRSSGELRLFTPVYAEKVPLHTFSALDREQVEGAVAKTYGPRVLRRIRVTERACKIVALDSLVLHPAFIKIDAEGFEASVLKGGEATLRRTRPAVLFEANHVAIDELKAFFQDLDYTIFNYDHRSDRFSAFHQDEITDASGLRNLLALPSERRTELPLAA